MLFPSHTRQQPRHAVAAAWHLVTLQELQQKLDVMLRCCQTCHSWQRCLLAIQLESAVLLMQVLQAAGFPMISTNDARSKRAPVKRSISQAAAG